MDFIKYVWKKKAQWANKPTMSIIFPAQNKSKVAAAKLQCRIEGKLRNHIMNTKHKHRCKKNVDFKNTKSYKLPLAHVAPLWDHCKGTLDWQEAAQHSCCPAAGKAHPERSSAAASTAYLRQLYSFLQSPFTAWSAACKASQRAFS